MDASDFYELWEVISQSMTTKDKTTVTSLYIDHLYENDLCDIIDLKEYAEEQDEDEEFIKELKYFVRNNDLEDEEDY